MDAGKTGHMCHRKATHDVAVAFNHWFADGILWVGRLYLNGTQAFHLAYIGNVTIDGMPREQYALQSIIRWIKLNLQATIVIGLKQI